MQDRVLAVDVGTTRTRVAYLSPDSRGPVVVRTQSTHLEWFPTALARTPHGGWLIGDAAMGQRLSRPDLYWSEIKRNIGEETPRHLGGHAFTVTEALAQIIGHAAMLARRHAGHNFGRLALAAPVEYEGTRLACLREAGELAGFAPEMITIITEPEAATQAALGPHPDDGQWVVFDLGGGTFDAALVRTRQGQTEVLDTVGDDRIGGFVLDDLIAERLTTIHSIEPVDDPIGQLRRALFLLDVARALKHGLTEQPRASAFLPDPPVAVELTTAELATLARPVITAALEHCTNMLERNDLVWSDVTAIITAGAATHAPALRRLIAEKHVVHAASTAAELAVAVGLLSPPAASWTAGAATATGRPGVVIHRDGATNQLTVAQVLPGHPGHVVPGADGHVLDAAFSPDGSLLATSGEDRAVRIWNVSTGACVRTLVLGYSARTISFSSDGSMLATGTNYELAKIDIWESASGTRHRTFEWGRVYSTVGAIAFSECSKYVAGANDKGSIRIWDMTTGDHYDLRKGLLDTSVNDTDRIGEIGSSRVHALAFSPNSEQLAAASYGDKLVRIWNSPIKHMPGRANSPTPAPDVLSRQYHRPIRKSEAAEIRAYFAAGTHDKVLEGHDARVQGLAFAPDGATIATVSDDKTARIWNAATGACQHVLTGHDAWIWGVAFSDDGAQLATASGDGSARLWDPASGTCVRNFNHHPNCVVLTVRLTDNTELELAVGTGDGVVEIWGAG